MSPPSSRDEILGKIRAARGRSGPVTGAERERLDARLKSRPRGIIPQKARNTGAALVQDFITRAQAVEATVQDISSLSEVPDAVAQYLADHNLPAAVKAAPHADLTQIDWSQRPTLTLSEGRSFGQDKVSLTRAFAGIAETGTLMLLAGPDAPTTLNFLPEHHIVILKRSEIVGAYEDAWDAVRDRLGPDGLLTRVVNMITGPSRTGDIEQTIELGAHGPLGLHILVLAD
jgi:L-lactate dehydrogenase complex protein LldG